MKMATHSLRGGVEVFFFLPPASTQTESSRFQKVAYFPITDMGGIMFFFKKLHPSPTFPQSVGIFKTQNRRKEMEQFQKVPLCEWKSSRGVCEKRPLLESIFKKFLSRVAVLMDPQSVWVGGGVCGGGF